MWRPLRIHDAIAAFRLADKAAFLQGLLLVRETGLLRAGAGSIDGTKFDANALKIPSVRHDRAQALRAKLSTDVEAFTVQAGRPLQRTPVRRRCRPRWPGAGP